MTRALLPANFLPRVTQIGDLMTVLPALRKLKTLLVGEPAIVTVRFTKWITRDSGPTDVFDQYTVHIYPDGRMESPLPSGGKIEFGTDTQLLSSVLRDRYEYRTTSVNVAVPDGRAISMCETKWKWDRAIDYARNCLRALHFTTTSE